MLEFREFGKIARLSRDCTITEKIDGTNACIYIGEDCSFRTGSRTRWITPEDDNHGFSKWAHDHVIDLLRLGPGFHYGEWWGRGIQRGYDQAEKIFSLFNVSRWSDNDIRPYCCRVVPVLARGIFSSDVAISAVEHLRATGSAAAPGFMNPEGIIIWHDAAQTYFKKTLDRDDEWKGKAK